MGNKTDHYNAEAEPPADDREARDEGATDGCGSHEMLAGNAGVAEAANIEK